MNKEFGIEKKSDKPDYGTLFFALSGSMTAWNMEKGPLPLDSTIDQLVKYLRDKDLYTKQELERKRRSFESIEPEELRMAESSRSFLEWLSGQDKDRKIIDLQDELMKKINK